MKRRAAAVLIALTAAREPSSAAAPGGSFRLYSWRCEPDWCFSLSPETTPRSNEDRIVSVPDALRVETLLAEVDKLPAGSSLTWMVPFSESRLAYPPAETVARVRRASVARGLRFYGPAGPLEEVVDPNRVARKAAWGQLVYYLDHQWVKLPDFEIRYLRTASQGTQPPYAVFSEFEVRQGDRLQVVKTDPNFGAWTPTKLEFAGKAYVLEVDVSDVLRTGSNHGDLYAWTAEEYARRLRKLYGAN